MDTKAFLDYLSALPDYAGQICHREHLAAREAEYVDPEVPLPPPLEACLHRKGVLPLYHHQAAAVSAAARGENVMVATASASGKTLSYNIPVLSTLFNERGSRALYLFPTKALAQDQLRSLRELACPDLLSESEIETFDGDTPSPERAAIRKNARIILTNPDMLHLGILPNHASWTRLLRHLRYVVIDEAHVYRGVFGSHVAGVMRRLRRLCQFYGAKPQFIASSATIANPGEHAAALTGLPFTTVSHDGAPRGGRDFIFWNPPLIDEAKSVRRSANREAATLLTELVKHDTRSLAFVRTRRLAELIYLYARKRLDQYQYGLGQRLQPYRAGYLPADRRRIEQALFNGELLGVVATNALELGIDIGDLEATVLTGYPGSIASAWQQAGRSGRGREQALSVMVGRNDLLDQYFMRHPDYFFGSSFENALTNPANPYILKSHLLCAAWESPLSGRDTDYFGETFTNARDELVKDGLLRERRHHYYPSPQLGYPAQDVNIRATSGASYAVIDQTSDSLLETVEASVAIFQIHPGAIYLHQGESYLITKLDMGGHTAEARPTYATHYTQTKELTEISIQRETRRRHYGAVTLGLGEVEVTTHVVGFKKLAQFSDEVIGEEPLDLPPQCFPTVALWFDLPPAVAGELAEAGLDLAGGIHAVEHAAIGILPLFALCDRNDIGGVSTTLHPDTGQAQVFIYDAYPGGVGIAEKGFDLAQELWQTTLRVIEECPCKEGCPSCIQSPKCGNNNHPLDKEAARLILKGILAS